MPSEPVCCSARVSGVKPAGGAAVVSAREPLSVRPQPVGVLASSAMLADTGPVTLPAASRTQAFTWRGERAPVSDWAVSVDWLSGSQVAERAWQLLGAG